MKLYSIGKTNPEMKKSFIKKNKIMHQIHGRRIPVILSSLLLIIAFSCTFKKPEAFHIMISENGRYFTDNKGNPFFWQGDTQWELLHLFTVSEAKKMMEERKKQGFNVIQVMVTGVFPEWASDQGLPGWGGMQAWKNNNPLLPDENYFRRADSIISAAGEMNMILVLGVFHGRDYDNGRITVENIKPWTRWLAARYRDRENIVWSMYPHADSLSKPFVNAAIQGILEGDGGNHLITMHPDPSPRSSSYMHSESWLSFNTLQTWDRGFMNYGMVKADYEMMPAKPVINGEARYEEEDGTTPFEARRPGYWSCLAGGFYSYGHRDNWKSPQTWQSWINSPGAGQMKIMGDIFRSVEWWNLIPDQAIFMSGKEGNAAARSKTGDWILAYITNHDTISIRLDPVTASEKLDIWLIHPVDGKRSRLGIFKNTDHFDFTLPENMEDAVLLCEKSKDTI